MAKKQFLLRLDNELWKELNIWAKDEFRSVNGQIEFLLNDAVKKYRKKQSMPMNSKEEAK